MNTSRLCVPIVGPSLTQCIEQMDRARAVAEIVELRWELIAPEGREAAEALCSRCQMPVIFTLRLQGEGGAFTGFWQDWCRSMEALLQLSPNWVDVEHLWSEPRIKWIKEHFPKQSILLSLHEQSRDEACWEKSLEKLTSQTADLYKLALPISSSSRESSKRG